jgi:DNA-binding NarL/FixJ family response regulator
VYLVDDDTDLLEGFAKELAKEPDISVVGTADTCAQALRETAAIKPDLVT